MRGVAFLITLSASVFLEMLYFYEMKERKFEFIFIKYHIYGQQSSFLHNLWQFLSASFPLRNSTPSARLFQIPFRNHATNILKMNLSSDSSKL